VAKNQPSWTFDADGWKKIVIGIQDKAAGSRGLLSPKENFCDDISSSDCIDMDEGSIEDNEEKKYTKQEVQNTEENGEYDDDDNNYFDNKAEYGSSNRNSSKDDDDTCGMNTLRRMKNMTMMMIIISRTKQRMVRATVTVAKMTKICVIMNTMMT
jgi:hypothetical protein